MTEPHDPLRSLDGTGPQGSWAGVVARAERPADLSVDLVAGGRSRRPLLVAAAVLALVGLAGTIAVATQAGDGNKAKVVAGPGDGDPPTAIWGRTWQVTRIVRDGKDQPVVPASPSSGIGGRAPLHLDATREGTLAFYGCNRIGGPVRLNGNRIERAEGIDSTKQGCLDGDGKTDPVMYQDRTLAKFLSSGVEVFVSGDELTLRNDVGDEIDLVDTKAFDPPVAIWGRTFTVTRLVEDGRELSPKASLGVPVRFRFKTVADANYGIVDTLGQAGCANQNPVSVRSDILAREIVELPNVPVCEFDVPEVATNRILVTQPIIQLRGDKLVLRSGTSSIEAVDPTGPDSGKSEDPPTAIWGKVGLVESRFDADHPDGLPVVDGSAGGPPILTAVLASDQPGSAEASPVGRVSVSGCNGVGGAAHLEGDVLVKDGDWPVTQQACTTAEGLVEQDAWIEGLLSSRPTVEVSGDRLTLAAGDGRRMELFLLPGGDEPPPGDPATTTTTTDGLVATTAPETTAPETTVSAPPPTTTSSTVPETTVPTEPPATTTTTTIAFGPGGGSADGFFGYEWHVVSVTGEGANREFRGAVVDTRTAGFVTISGCNGAGGAMQPEGDRLVKDGDWIHTAKGCPPTGDGEDLMAQDAWYEAFLTDGPRVVATPDSLGSAVILDTGTATVHLERP